jgi:chromosome segregation ATPase
LGSVYSRAIDVFTSELGEAANNAELSNNNMTQMKEYLKTQETSVIDLTREKTKLADELEQVKHDLERLTRTKETEIGSLNDRISKFEEQI